MPHAPRVPRPACALALAALVALPGVAAGHTGLASTSPPSGGTVATPPRTVTLTFTAGLGSVDAVTVVRAGRDHVRAVRLDPRDRRRVLVTTRPGQAGAYTVTWRVRAADGHAVEGTLGFRARRGAASPAPAGMPSIATALARAESGALALARGLAG